MQTYSEFSPTPFDPKGAFLRGYSDNNPDRQNWLVLPVSRTRDTGSLEESNFETALALLGGESDTVEVHRFGHWGPGWFEIILVNPDSPQAGIAKDIESRLEDYPLLDEDDYCEREFDDARKS